MKLRMRVFAHVGTYMQIVYVVLTAELNVGDETIAACKEQLSDGQTTGLHLPMLNREVDA